MTEVQLRCETCSSPFVISPAERLFYAERGYHEPTNCPSCRARHRASRHSERLATSAAVTSTQRLGTYGGLAPVNMRQNDATTRYTATCSSCGGEAVVPFQPRHGRPVYCRKCFGSRRQA